MTPQEHQLLELKIRLIAQNALLTWLADLHRGHVASLPQSQREYVLMEMASKLSKAEADYSDMTFDGIDAATSDMQAGMFQEAFAEISKGVMDKIASGFTPDELRVMKEAGL